MFFLLSIALKLSKHLDNFRFLSTLKLYVTHDAKMRRFSKIMVVCFIAYLDTADSDGNDYPSMLLTVTLFPEIHLAI